MKSILLIGLGRFGSHIARKLNDMGHEVMAVDNNEERINNASTPMFLIEGRKASLLES